MTGLFERQRAASHSGRVIAEKYRLLHVIGTGGMGAVYAAEHVVTRRRLAVKIVHAWIRAAFGSARARFLQEAQAPASIGHRAVVEVLDAGEEPDGTLYLVFELLEGESLAKVLRAGSLSLEQMITVCIEVLDALDSAHARGIIHRDIKPENVFLARGKRSDVEVKLLDFGIAKRAARSDPDLTQHGAVIGTIEYMSPEQARGEAIDHRTDIWSVGAMLYEAFSGAVPVKARGTYEVPPLASVAPSIGSVIFPVVDRALAVDREARWASAREFLDALAACRSTVRAAAPIVKPMLSPSLLDGLRVDAATERAPIPKITPAPVVLPTWVPSDAETDVDPTSEKLKPTLRIEARRTKVMDPPRRGDRKRKIGLGVAVATLLAVLGASIAALTPTERAPAVEAPLTNLPVVEAQTIEETRTIEKAPVIEETPVIENALVIDEVPVIEKPRAIAPPPKKIKRKIAEKPAEKVEPWQPITDYE